MRCLSEPVARQANREEGVTGRFKPQALLDEKASLGSWAGMAGLQQSAKVSITFSENICILRNIECNCWGLSLDGIGFEWNAS